MGKPVCEHEPFLRLDSPFVVSFACTCVKCGEVVDFKGRQQPPKRHLRLVR